MLIVEGTFGRYVVEGGRPEPVAWVNGPERVTLPAPQAERVIEELLTLLGPRPRCCGIAIYSKHEKHSAECPVGAAKKMLDLIDFAEKAA